ncbi:hypothetical protein ROBYS_17190 [Roseobacter sp. OBYS 0001]|nr:hypothetical protein ROBYS_17190 [Roseobacter sp. OBYS 0001]
MTFISTKMKIMSTSSMSNTFSILAITADSLLMDRLSMNARLSSFQWAQGSRDDCRVLK